MKIIFIRHLPTPGNEKRQYIGSTDEDLSQGAVERFRKMQPDNREGIYPPVARWKDSGKCSRITGKRYIRLCSM